jgi:CBS domain containing-hemolysin-like protein
MSGTASELGWMLAGGGAVLLFVLAATLSAALVACSALSRVALHRLGTEPGSRLEFVETLRDPASVHRIAVQLAKNMCLLGAAVLLVVAVRDASWSRWDTLGLGLAVVIGLGLLELTLARLLGLWKPRMALRFTAFLLRSVRLLLFPVAQPLHLLSVKIRGLQPSIDDSPEEDQNEEVDALIEVGERDGILEADEGEMMRSIADLDQTAVREIMTPRPDIVALPVEQTLDGARRLFLESGQSRLPVYRGSLDEVVGVLHVRDLLRATEKEGATQTVSQYMRAPMFVPERLSVADLLSEMRLKTHMALVVDEYGGTAGLVTLEDLLEEIVGEIRDEHEPGETLVRHAADGSWIINAGVHVDKLTELFGVEFTERDFDTIGGLVVSELGYVPREGETLQFRSLCIEVLDADRRRIRMVRIGRHPRSETARAEP